MSGGTQFRKTRHSGDGSVSRDDLAIQSRTIWDKTHSQANTHQLVHTPKHANLRPFTQSHTNAYNRTLLHAYPSQRASKRPVACQCNSMHKPQRNPTHANANLMPKRFGTIDGTCENTSMNQCARTSTMEGNIRFCLGINFYGQQ